MKQAATPPSRRSAVGQAFLATLLVASIVVAPLDTRPADASHNLLTFVDVHGPDDAGTQADLVQTSVDYSHISTENELHVNWLWDETSYPGANTGDACALFDSDGDGNANFAICVTIEGDPATQAADSPRLYDCTADSRNDRCGGAVEISPILSTCTVSIDGTDTLADCVIDLNDVSVPDAFLLNACSFNSEEPNSNPPDCVLGPGMGLTIIKDVTDDAAIESVFDVSIAGVGTTTLFLNGDDTFYIALPPGNHSVTETSTDPLYILDSSSCSSGTPGSFSLAFGATEAITCTFVNRPRVPSMSAVKSFTADPVAAGSTGNTFAIDVTNDGELPLTSVNISDVVDPAFTVTNILSSHSGDCTASSGNSIDCTIGAIPVGETATVTVAYSVDSALEPSNILNTATVTSVEVPAPLTPSDLVAVVEEVSLSAVKTFTTNPVAAGSTSNTFTIAVTNNGPSDTENVAITDTVDPTLTVTNVSADSGADCSSSSGNNIDCSLASLAAGSTVTVTVTYSVPSDVEPATVSNTANVASDEDSTTAQDTVGVVEDVTLSAVKAFTADPVTAGSTGNTFTIAVTNNGPSDTENVAITDTVDPALTVTNVSADSGADCSSSSGNNIDCSLATLTAGSTVTVTVTYDVDTAIDTSTINNTASISSDEDSTTAQDTLEITEDVTLAATKTFTADPVTAGSTGNTFTIAVTNNGTSTADNISITDTVDPALTVTNVSIDNGDCSASSGQSVDCSLATLAAGSTVTVTVTYDVATDIDTSTINNTASISSDEDSTTAQDTVDITEDVTLSAVKTFTADPVTAGTTGYEFTIAVTNNGTSTADNISITDTVDPALTVTNVSADSGADCSSSSGNNIDCSLASLAAGSTVTVTVTYSVPSDVEPATVSNTANVASDEDSTTAQDTVGVVEDVTLSAVKAFTADPVTAGSTGNTFTIAVTNNGPSDTENVAITDTVDPALTVTNVSIDNGDCSASSGQSVDCSLATLTAGSTVTVTVTYDVDTAIDTSTINNTASISSDEDSTTAQDTVDITEDVTLAATKTFTADPVTAGSTGNTFTIAVTNNGTSTADNISITDVVDASLTVTNVTADSGADCSTSTGNLVTCSLTTLASGATVTVTVTYSMPSDVEPGTISNTANISSDEDSTTAQDTVDVTEDVTLAATKAFTPDPVAAGTTGNTFTIEVTNNGPSDTENLSITDTVDPALTVTNVSIDNGDCSASSGQSVDCSLATLTAGSTVTVTVTYSVPADVEPATISNTASISSDEDSTTAQDTVDVVEAVTLSAVKTFTADPVTAGTTGNTFTIEVTNNGPSDTENLSITDTVDPALTVTNVSADSGADCSGSSGNNVDCSLGSLAAGSTVTVTVTFSVSADAEPGIVSNTANISSDEDSTTAQDTVTVVENVALSAVKTFTADPVTAGSTGNTFTIMVANTGLSVAQNISVTDTVDSALIVTGVSISPSGDCSASSGNDVDCSVTSLIPGGSVLVTVTYSVPSDVEAGTISNTANIASDEDSTTAQDTVDVVEEVTLSAVKTFTADPVTAGSTGNTFTIAVTNNGPSDTENLSITDTVDPALTVTNVSADSGADCSSSSGNNIDCSLATLTAGSTVTVTVTYSVPSDVEPGTISNTANIASDEDSTTAQDTVDVVEAVTLSAVKTFTADPVTAGSTGNTFTIAVTNNGPSDTENLSITDTVDPALTVTNVSADSGADCSSSSGNNIDCSLATLTAGSTVTVTVTYSVPSDVEPGTISNTANVRSDEDSTTAQDTVDVVEDVTLSAVKTFTADPVTAGTTGNTFTIAVTNNGASTADNISITDVVDASLTVTNVSADSGADCSSSSGNNIDCSLATLTAGSTVTVTVSYSVPSDVEPGTISNTANIASDEDSTTAQDTVDVVEDVTLSAVKTFTADPVTAGSTGNTFTIAVTNNGPSDTENLSITDTVDSALTVTNVSADSGADCSASSGQSVDCTLATLTAGSTVTVTVTYDVDAGVDTSTINNTANITSDEDSTTAEDTVDVVEDVTLSAVKTFTADPVTAGSTGNTFTIAVTNNGTSTTDNISITDTVDPALTVTNVSADSGADCSTSTGNLVTCSLTTLASGATVTVTVTYSVTSDVEPGTIPNTANISSDEDSTTAEDTVEISEGAVPVADLSVTKSADTDTVAAGGTVTYTIVVTNGGPDTALGALITDPMPLGIDSWTWTCAASGSAVASCGISNGTGDISTGVDLGPGDTATITVVAVIESDYVGAIANTASSSHPSDPDPSDDVSVSSIDVTPTSDVGIEKTSNSSSVSPGATIIYTLTVTNAGPTAADGVVVTDTLPDGVTHLSTTTSRGSCNIAGQIVTCQVGDMAVDDLVVVTITVRVDSSSAGSDVTNSAAVSSSSPDPDPSNDISSTSVSVTANPPILPFTGAEVLPKVITALLSLLFGVVILATTRRREEDEPQAVRL